MRNRLLVLGVVLALLIGLYIAGVRLYRGGEPTSRRAFPTIESPESLLIERPGADSVALERTDVGWRVVEGEMRYPARDERVESFLEVVRGAELGRTVTANQEAHAALGLTESTASVLSISESGRTVEALVGDQGTAPDTAYFRFPASNEARLLRGGLRFYLTQRRGFWADLRVFYGLVDSSAVVRMDLNDATVIKRSEDDRWVLDDSDLDQDRVRELVRMSARFEATEYVPYQPNVDWTRSLRLHLDDGRVFAMYADDSGRVMAEGPGLPTDDDGFPYHYRSATVDRVFPAIADLSQE